MSIASLLSTLTSFIPGPRLVDGGDCQNLANYLLSFKNAITAKVGGTAANSPVLGLAGNEVDTSTGSNTDSVTLPLAIPGSIVYLNNNTANTITVFGAASNPNNAASAADTIAPHNTTVQAASQTQATAILAQYLCTTAGQWKQGLMS